MGFNVKVECVQKAALLLAHLAECENCQKIVFGLINKEES